jgi:GDP-4-dehydro-6-deoxy-D-mannose reductase
MDECPHLPFQSRKSRPSRPLHPYGISKVCLDLLAREYFLKYKIPTINLRLFNTTGPGKTNDAPSDFVRQLIRVKRGLQPPTIDVGNLKPRRAFLHVDDAVRGFYLAALRGQPGEAYNLCAARTHRIGEVLRIAIALSGLKVEIRSTASLMRPSDEKIIFGSSKKIRKHTGWKAMFSIKQTLGSMLEYWETLDGNAQTFASCPVPYSGRREV